MGAQARVTSSGGAALEHPLSSTPGYRNAQRVQSLEPVLHCGQAQPLCSAGGQVAEELRARVREQTRVTCSCGVAPNRLLAKIASDINKPNGQFVLPGETDAVAAFMARLPIRKVPGIGKVGALVFGVAKLFVLSIREYERSHDGSPLRPSMWHAAALQAQLLVRTHGVGNISISLIGELMQTLLGGLGGAISCRVWLTLQDAVH